MSRKMSSINILRHCQCGMCGHYLERECVEMECRCCVNFHVRSGSKSNGNRKDA